MAKKGGKSIKAVWICSETKAQSGIFKINKDKIKELAKRLKYSPALRKKTLHTAKEAK